MVKLNMVAIVFLAFVTIVVGISLFTAAASQAARVTSALPIANETINVTIDEWENLTSTPISGVTSITNTTGSVISDTLYDVRTDPAAVNITQGSGIYYVAYNYYDSAYVSDSSARNVTALVIIFFALAILVAGILFFSESARDWAKGLFK